MPDPRRAVVSLLCCLPLAGQAPSATPPEPEAPRAVLVTGASSGIGRRTTEVLAQNGFFVFAGARKDDDLRALDAIANVRGVRLDVTRQDQIDAAVALVRESGRGLFALVNNAGIATLAPLVEVRDEDLVQQFEVNVFGPVRVTRAFAPLLLAGNSRVLTIGSISGVVTWPMGGPYTMSKHAVEAFGECLALELLPFGATSSVIEPGNYRSEIFANMQERLAASGYSPAGSRYREQMERMLAVPTGRAGHKEPDEVAQTVLRALTDAEPRRHYLVVPNQREAEITIRAAIGRVVQLNAGQPYEYDRDALVRMLDEALQQQQR